VSARLILSASVRLAVTLAAWLLGAAAADAGNWTFHAFDPPATYTGEIGLRFLYGGGRTGKSLYDVPGTSLVSRLSYNGFSTYAAEGYGRFDLNTGWFVKGLVGGGGFRGGTLKDEDFPPGISPYSATISIVNNGAPFYATVDVGYNVIRGPDFRLGAFAGYNYLYQTVSAFGCTQVASNPDICGTFPVPENIKGITQDNGWHSLRLGLNGQANLTDRLKVELDAAYLPIVSLYGSDAHWLRISNQPGDFNGPVPEDGSGWGYQLEGVLSYQVTNSISVGIGGRYWHMQTSGLSHFEGHVNGFIAFPQPVDWHTDNIAAFVQTGFKFGPNPIISSN